MESFLIRLVIGVLVLLLTEKLLGVFQLAENTKQIINVVVILAVVIYIIAGNMLQFN